MCDAQAEDIVVRVLRRNHCVALGYSLDANVFLEIDDLWFHLRNFLSLNHFCEIRLGIGVLCLYRFPARLVDFVLLREAHLRTYIKIIVGEIQLGNLHYFIFCDFLNAFCLSEIVVVCHAALLEFDHEICQ